MNIDKLKAELRANPLFLKERLDIHDRAVKKIGYGHDLNSHPLPASWTIPITFDQAESLLGMDARRIEEECDQRLSNWTQRDPVRQLATAIMVYALGIEAVARWQTFNTYIRQCLWEQAALMVEKSAFARDEPEIAARVVALVRTGHE